MATSLNIFPFAIHLSDLDEAKKMAAATNETLLLAGWVALMTAGYSRDAARSIEGQCCALWNCYLYQHSQGEVVCDTEDEAFIARELNGGRGMIFRILDGEAECVA